MKHKDISAVLLAAGKGVRFRSRLPKVMHNMIDKPMIYYPIRALLKAGIRDIVVVLGFGAEYVKDYIKNEFVGETIRFVIQKVQRGTGDAVKLVLQYKDPKVFATLWRYATYR